MDDIIIHFRLKSLEEHTPNKKNNDNPYQFPDQFLQQYAEWERLVFKTASEHLVNKRISSENERCIHIEILISENPHK